MKKLAWMAMALMLAAGLVYAGGDKKKKERPSKAEIEKLQTITLQCEVKDGELHMSWTPATGEDSGGVKIAYSTDSDQPLYGFDPYAAWLPGSGKSSCVIDNRKAACDKERYYRVCSVTKKSHREFVAVSNVIKVPPIEMTEKTKAYNEKKKAEYAAKKAKKDAAKLEKKDKKADAAVPTCPKCGWKGTKDDKFCAKCGTKMK